MTLRELKFRAWVGSENTDFIDMPSHYEYDVTLVNGKYADVESGWDIHGVFENVPIEQEVEQYTGLKDKNGKEIYEGDIVSEEFEYGGEKAKTIWQVRWCDDECAFNLHYVSGFDVDDCWLVADDVEEYEVIGNIHENPELLEAKNER